jgi:preprotein translocase subunit Sec63
MAPVEITDDYYAILEVSQIANAIDIKKSYHRLAILLHPDKNQNKPNATASFQLVSVSSANSFPEFLRTYRSSSTEHTKP